MSYTKQVVFFIIIFLFHTFVYEFPNYWAWKNTPINYSFTSITSYFDSWDTNVYLSIIKRAPYPDLRNENAYITTDSYINLYPFYTVIGILLSNTQPEIIYFVLTQFSRLTFLLACYHFSKRFLSTRYALLTTFLIPIAGGLGWLTRSSADILITPFTLVGAYNKPHELLAISFLISSYYFVIQISKNPTRKTLIFAIISSLGVLIFYPYYILSLSLFSIISFLLRFRSSQRFQIFNHFSFYIALTGIFTLLYSWHITSSTTLENVLNPQLSIPKISSFLLGIGPYIPLLIIGLLYFFKKGHLQIEGKSLFLKVVLNTILLYSGLSFSRYFFRGIIILLIVLSFLVIRKFLFKWKLALLPLFILASVLSSLYIFTRRIYLPLAPLHWYYLTSSQIEVLNYLNTNSNPNSGVLAPYPFSNFIPAKTFNKVYVGHPYQTPNSGEKLQLQNMLYNDQMNSERMSKIFSDNEISYMIRESKEEKMINYIFLQEVYKNKDFSLFKFSTN